jgi:hypothetical protein
LATEPDAQYERPKQLSFHRATSPWHGTGGAPRVATTTYQPECCRDRRITSRW